MTGLQKPRLDGLGVAVFLNTEGKVATEAEDPPEWSGQFMEVGQGVALMRVHNSDTRQHFAPAGWQATGHNTFDDGSFETFTFVRVGTTHHHIECPECGV